MEGSADHEVLRREQALTPYEFRLPGALRVGVGAHRVIPEESARLGGPVLVVSDANCARIPEVADLTRALGGRLFVDIPGEPTTDDVARALSALREQGAQVVVGLGGGAVLDVAKAVAVMATNPGTIADYMGRDKVQHPRLPLVLAPTTAGTGSEATRHIAITDAATHVKMLITDWKLLPDVAVVDPLLCMGAPPSVTASSGIDALTHAIEAYVSQRRQPTADLFALGAIGHLRESLRRAFADGADLSARTDTAIGALHAGIAFSNSSVALVHGMSRPIGAYFHVPHGLANSMLLPAVTAWSIPGAPERYGDVARALGLGSADNLPGFLEELGRDLRIPPLRQVVPPEKIRAVARKMAHDALESGSPGNNPRVPTEDEIVELYERCL